MSLDLKIYEKFDFRLSDKNGHLGVRRRSGYRFLKSLRRLDAPIIQRKCYLDLDA